ncbi:HD domain-containing protein [Patescibacteria group bacterium]
MHYQDQIYGKIEITEPVLVEITNSPALQRLKGVEQGAFRKPFHPGISPNRFQHSVGVMLLLKKYGAAIDEQISGLIHDASHSAFSHGIDYILKQGTEKTQNHQDSIFNNYIRKTDIPSILSKYHFDLDHILNDSHFPLKENNIPDLCADRIDYALRDGIAYEEYDFSIQEAQNLLTHLTVKDNQWIFSQYTHAATFAKLFYELNKGYWADMGSGVMFQTVGDYIAHAITMGYIVEQDLYTTDQIVLNKIAPFLSNDTKAQSFWDRMNNKIKYKNSPSDFDAHVFVKSRAVDPLCYHEEKIKRVSDINPQWKKIVKEELKPKEYFIKFEK